MIHILFPGLGATRGKTTAQQIMSGLTTMRGIVDFQGGGRHNYPSGNEILTDMMQTTLAYVFKSEAEIQLEAAWRIVSWMIFWRYSRRCFHR